MPDPSVAERARYASEIASGTGRFLESRRSTCPWCGSPCLEMRLRTNDILQGKPGTFVLDRCRICGHVFQNPRLNEAGLEFYYRDFYDGFGTELMDWIFSTHGWLYESRARMCAPFFTDSPGPKRWLDVGAGYGHFAHTARTVWPDTTFDGLDMGTGIEVGRERGWLDTAWRGTLAEHAEDLAGHYDVLSMHHYLEHTRDPRAELDLAAQMLPVGGLLQIEMPDVTTWLGRVFGRWWSAWCQPQHQHLIPLSNLLVCLRERGFTPVAVQRESAHMGGELSCALSFLINAAVPDPRVPWLPEPTSARLRRHELTWKFAPGVLNRAVRADAALLPVMRALRTSNAFRVLARR